jgi:hypothetical protein
MQGNCTTSKDRLGIKQVSSAEIMAVPVSVNYSNEFLILTVEIICVVTSNSSFMAFIIKFQRNKSIKHCKARNLRFCDLRMVTVQEWISRLYLRVRHEQGSDSFIYVNI